MDERWYQETIEMVDRGWRRFCRKRGLNPNCWMENREAEIRSAIKEKENNELRQIRDR